jgi:4-carboxymuconolactone decarboxylase
MDTKLLEHYRTLLGFIPENIRRRITLAELTGQEESVEAVEHMREILIHNNPLGAKIQQLVHFAMLVAIGETEPARLHVRGALRAGATPGDLYGVCETAAIVGGMPAFSIAVDLVYEALDESGLIAHASNAKEGETHSEV